MHTDTHTDTDRDTDMTKNVGHNEAKERLGSGLAICPLHDAKVVFRARVAVRLPDPRLSLTLCPKLLDQDTA